MEEHSIRFRHTLGDIGPFQFDSASSIQSVKDALFDRWPTGDSTPQIGGQQQQQQ